MTLQAATVAVLEEHVSAQAMGKSIWTVKNKEIEFLFRFNLVY